MATDASKIDTATEKAYTEAAAENSGTNRSDDNSGDSKADAKQDVSVAAIVQAVEADQVTPAKKTPVKKAVARKPAAKKVAAKKIPAAKKAVAAKKTAAPKRKVAPSKTTNSTPKETIMTKAQNKATDFAAQTTTAQAKEGLADMQNRAKAAYEKGTEFASEMGEFTKGNVEAVVESGKILAAGMQDISKDYVEDAKGTVETVTADVKEVAAVKSPTDFVQLQGKIASRNFDATIAAISKNAEAWVKLTNDAFAPISGRMSVAMDKVRKVA